MNRRYEVGVGVRPLSDRRFFHRDDQLPAYLAAKQRATAAGADTLMCDCDEPTRRAVWAFIANRVNAEYHLALPPAYHAGAFAEAGQHIAEDLAIVRMTGDREWASLLDVRLPSGWDPAVKIGRSFAEVHAPVPGMDTVRAAGASVVRMMITQKPMQRFVWGVQFDDALDHHPQRHRRSMFNSTDPRVWVRVERQITVGFPSVGAALFIIRLYVYPAASLDHEQRAALADALATMSPASREYKGVADHFDAVLDHLRQGSG